MIQVISVYNKAEFPENVGAGIIRQAQDFFEINSIEDIRCVKKYYLEGLSSDEAKLLAEKLFSEAIWQDYKINTPFFNDTPYHVEVAYKPGMMNPEVASIKEAIADIGIAGLVEADTSHEYFFYGDNIRKEDIETVVQKIIMNNLIEDVRTETPKTLLIQGIPNETQLVELIQADDEALMQLSKDKLFLSLEEMRAIAQYFKTLSRNPTDCEVETIAQTWSEHCNHKTFRAKLKVNGKDKASLYSRLQKCTKDIAHPSVVSAFKDNSGVFDFYNGYAVCGKVETHNSPSALDPYGGAMTGSGGVFRDILGTGQGSRVIASTDIFCFGIPEMDPNEVPKGCKHPRYIFKRVIDGVRDYGNRIGIPTNNGSVHVHPDFRAKPAVIVGAYGILPKDKAQKGEAQPGDKIITIGGRTGRDGIHGATFSSAEMTADTENINASAVQIGNAIEEHRVIHAVLALRDQNLIRAITDCGAGGFSSAIGEMGEKTGAKVQLEKIPLKYHGLAPWEIWISESQERMVLCIESQNVEKVSKICKKFNVEMSEIGEFTADKKLRLTYNEQVVCDIDMDFLHDGIPEVTLVANYQSPKLENPVIARNEDATADFKRIMSHWNVCSKEAIVRMYDHNIQGSAVQMPFSGKTHSAPSDAAVIEPILGSGQGLAISNGLNPVLMKIDPYFGAQWAILEAVSNVIATGADPEKIALIDNFIWPKPDEHFLGCLDMAIDACTDTAKVLGMPFISGKDSLSGSYKSAEENIDIPPVLCVSCFAPIDDISRTISSHFKAAGNLIYIIGETTNELGGSIFYDIYQGLGKSVPKAHLPDVLEIYKHLSQAISRGLVKACHDISEGGLATAVTEMAFGNLLGVKVEIADCPVKEGSYTSTDILFSETPGRFVVEVEPDMKETFEEVMNESSCKIIGNVTDSGQISIAYQNKTVISGPTEEWLKIWKAPADKLFQ